MFIDVVLFMLAGIAVGVVTGLVPGIHPNTVFASVFSFLFVFNTLPLYLVMVFVVSLAVSNTFTDFLPSILFGAPEPSTALSILPGHSLLLEGRGYEAVFLTVVGGIGVGIITVLTLPILIYAIPFAYSMISAHIPVLLTCIVVWMVLREGRKSMALSVFMLAGIFGIVVLGLYPGGGVIFPAFTGLFAFSTLIVSVGSSSVIPRQSICIEKRELGRSVVAGWLGGWFSGMLPGLGAAQAAAVISSTMKADKRGFLVAIGGINTSNILFTFIIFCLLEKTRSGAAWLLSQFLFAVSPWMMLFLILTGVTVCFVSSLITLLLARIAVPRIGFVNYPRLSLYIIILLLCIVFLLSGPLGLFVSVTGTMVGLVAVLGGVRRSHLMGFLILPTILYLSGVYPLMLFVM